MSNIDEMTQAEKVEDLRKDMRATMATVKFWIQEQKRLGDLRYDLTTKQTAMSHQLSELAAALRSLEERIAKLDR